MPLLISGGDSFTWGSELPDQRMNHMVNKPSTSTWSALIAKHYNMDYICTAKPGGANNTIVRRIIKEINAHKGEEIFVAVMWTFTHRSETRLKNLHKLFESAVVAARYDIDDSWINFNAWHGLPLDEKMSFFNQNISDWGRRYFREQHDKLTEIGVTEASEKFYKITGDYVYHNLQTLKDICLLQYYCKRHNIPYFFCTASDELLITQAPEVIESGLYDDVFWDNWYHDAAFHPWAKNHPQCGNHPGIEAHSDWFNLILPKVSQCFMQNK